MAQAQVRLAPVQAEFDSISLTEIGARFKYNREAIIAWCREFGLLATRMDCPRCGHHCNEQQAPDRIDGITWRCMEKNCKRRVNIRHGSFFEQSKLPLWKVIGATFIWSSNAGRSRGPAQDVVRNELDVKGEHTLVDWFQFCRDVCVEHFLANPVQVTTSFFFYKKLVYKKLGH